MICLVLSVNIELKMSSKLTFICDSNHSDSPPSVLYGAGIFDNLREFSEERMAPIEIFNINKTYDRFKSVGGIEPPCINFQKGAPCVESATARSTRYQFCNLGKRNCAQASLRFPDNPSRLWISIKKGGRLVLEAPVYESPASDSTSGHSNSAGSGMRGVQQWNITKGSWANTGGPIPPQRNPIGAAPEVPIFVTRKDGQLGQLKRNLVVQDEIDTDSEGSDQIDGEELEITTTIQKTNN
ncbi:hypothetical protein O181_118578 [Austropuccinia psidii MF-1]|uniref:Uncharacterized protein n=1 Tax=Austropuccinia psidii MF-1 TaxID=1389203 RepID=A0A9Q3KCA0_9BASI|nr:hypothetical protein [Austropuccinia psidii MF-1]